VIDTCTTSIEHKDVNVKADINRKWNNKFCDQYHAQQGARAPDSNMSSARVDHFSIDRRCS
jgi:hypothetical protein